MQWSERRRRPAWSIGGAAALLAALAAPGVVASAAADEPPPLDPEVIDGLAATSAITPAPAAPEDAAPTPALVPAAEPVDTAQPAASAQPAINWAQTLAGLGEPDDRALWSAPASAPSTGDGDATTIPIFDGGSGLDAPAGPPSRTAAQRIAASRHELNATLEGWKVDLQRIEQLERTRLEGIDSGAAAVLADAQWDESKGKRVSKQELQSKVIVWDRLRGEQILDYDTQAKDGRAQVVVGDIDNAKHLVVYVPGRDVKIDNMRDVANDARAIQFATAQIAQEPVAVVACLCSDHPDVTTREALKQPDVAAAINRAIADLPSQVRAITALNPQAHATLVGYSYGSYVVGQALKTMDGGKLADDVVVIGSPGVGASSVAELASHGGVRADHVYAGGSPNDPIIEDYKRAGEPIGRVPSDPRFGAKIIDTDTNGHTYLNVAQNPRALASIANVAAGRGDRALAKR